MSDKKIVSVDLETNGTDINLHHAWEVGIVEEEGWEHLYQFAIPREDFQLSQPEALTISGYYDRYQMHNFDSDQAIKVHDTRASGQSCALEIMNILDGVQLLGCAIQFDMKFLDKLLRRFNVVSTWHHRGLDLGSYAAGVEGAYGALSSKAMQERVPNNRSHTALGDAIWNWEAFDYFIKKAKEKS